MKNLKLIVGSLICAGCLLAPLSVMAGYKINTIPVHFDKGTSGTTITNALSGAELFDRRPHGVAGFFRHETGFVNYM